MATLESKNNFDGVRIGLALIVVFSHVVALTQIQEFVGLKIFDAVFAVKGFFAISGFLVMKSYLSSSSLFDFAEKRFRRIYPAYVSVILLCFFIGLIFSSLSFSDFIASSDTFKYLLWNLLFLNFLQPTLPGVFTENALHAMNGSLWTIKIEIALYFCVPLISILFRRFGVIKSSLALVFVSVAWVMYFSLIVGGGKGAELAKQVPGQLSYFVIGSCLAVSKVAMKHIFKVVCISAAIYFLSPGQYVSLAVEPFFYASLVVFLATSAARDLNLGKFGDVSYGIYLFHFPIIQVLLLLGVFKVNPWVGLAATVFFVSICSFFSWHLIEKRFLKRNSHYVLATRTQST